MYLPDTNDLLTFGLVSDRGLGEAHRRSLARFGTRSFYVTLTNPFGPGEHEFSMLLMPSIHGPTVDEQSSE